MIVLDAYAVLAFLEGEAAAPEVRELLEGPEPAALTTVGVTEVLDHLVRIVGADEDDAVLDLAALGLFDPIPFEASTAAAAGLLRARRYHRTRCAVSLADCIAVESARRVSGTLATSDPHLLQVCHLESVPHRVLVGSDGSRWCPPDEPGAQR